MKKYDFNQFELYKLMKRDYGNQYGLRIGKWVYAGKILYNTLSGFNYLRDEFLCKCFERIVVPRNDKKGVNCYWKTNEPTEFIKKHFLKY